MKLKAKTKYEAAEPKIGIGKSHLSSSPIFPHIYGPIDNSAIDGIGILCKEGSSYVWPKEFISLNEYFSKIN